MDTRSKLERAIRRVASKAAQTGKQPDVTETALRLSSRNPQSGKTIAEIEADLQTALEANKQSEA